MTPPATYAELMEQGSNMHAAGQPERALVAFERALALQPGDANAASACAAMLAGTGQAAAAYRILQTARSQLMASADGATNLAIAAEDCGQPADAQAAYARALELDPDHLRALNNSALAAARAGDWDTALGRLRRCQDLAPDEPQTWLNLSDVLVAARRCGEAADLLSDAIARFGAHPVLRVRHTLALAFAGQVAAAQKALDTFDPEHRRLLTQLLEQAGAATGRMVRKTAMRMPDASELFCQQAFGAMQVCDWRDHDHLTAVIREMEAQASRTGQYRDGRDTQFYGLMLPLHEDELALLRTRSIAAIGGQLATPMAPFVASRSRHRDQRIHVGLAVQSLKDPRTANALVAQLQAHDQARFAIHVYSPTPEPDLAFTAELAALCAGAVEIGHMTDDEAVGRMRIDELDVFVDMAFDTPWCRPEIPERRVAPVQIRQTTWHRHHPPRPCDYNMSDRFVHPDGLALGPYGAVVRLPHTCWLATCNDVPQRPAPPREALGLPPQGLVLCTLVAPLMVDPETFALWMDILHRLPGSVWWLPAYELPARRNLAAAARAAGIDAERLVFMQRCARGDMLARIARADLFVDTLRFNANHGLVDALRMGLPALGCAGNSMASRLGGSILAAAGLAECISSSKDTLLQQVIRLGQDPAARAALRQRLADAQAQAPLFQPVGRVREWEWAWAEMVRRHQAGLPPAAFDVPDQSPAPAGAATVSS
jgi:predicted O-linked N-acetylglucosamine transferase (SPINDLY family)